MNSRPTAICFDSRKAIPGCLFVAIKGTQQDGNQFIPIAIQNGATTIVHEDEITHKEPHITYIKVRDTRKALSELAEEFYGFPSKKLKLIGVTGTNGKTTTVTLLFNLFRSLGYHAALLSTIENKVDDEIFPADQTTPDPVSLSSFLAQAAEKGCAYAFMECSSHAIHQKRTYALQFTGVLFTNLTQDHLDYHQTMEAYAEAKKEIFDTLPETAFAVFNKDDAYASYMARDTKAKKYFFTLAETPHLESMLIGKYNQSNLAGIYTIGKILGITDSVLRNAIKTLKPPKGRMEMTQSKRGIIGIVDYAHTPDALLNVLKTIRESFPQPAKIITVIGCGGDRDTSKRPIMGSIAVEHSDFVIFTSDNPRSEDPRVIISDIITTLSDVKNYVSTVDRKKAIQQAVEKADIGDIILLAGKGHEEYQIIGPEKIHFSDMEELENNFNKI